MTVDFTLKDVEIMLPSLPFQGTTKVINKGVDITIVADRDTIGTAMKASRILVVRGISTVVLEVTCLTPIDERTLSHFIEATSALIFVNQSLYMATRHLLKPETLTAVCTTASEQEFVRCANKIIKLK